MRERKFKYPSSGKKFDLQLLAAVMRDSPYVRTKRGKGRAWAAGLNPLERTMVIPIARG